MDEAPDREKLTRLVVAKGYLCWTFRPIKRELWRETVGEDDALGAGGVPTLSDDSAPNEGRALGFATTFLVDLISGQ